MYNKTTKNNRTIKKIKKESKKKVLLKIYEKI